MRILVTGAQGRLGAQLATTLRERGHDVSAVGRGDFDITDYTATRAFIADWRPDLVVHCAAWTDVDGCARDPEQAISVNGFGTQHVALGAAAAGAAILYVSSNEVFDGRLNRPYREYDAASPANPYGYSKWVGERALADVGGRHYIVRTSWLFAHGGGNFIHAILSAVNEGRPLRVVTDEVANPTYNDDLADAIARLIATERYGIYHFVNEGACSRYDFARYVLERAGYANVPLERIASSQWPRPSKPPAYSGLSNLAGRQIGIVLRPWQEAVAAFLKRENLR